MFYAAQSLVVLQALYGIIPNIYGKGVCAKVKKQQQKLNMKLWDLRLSKI